MSKAAFFDPATRIFAAHSTPGSVALPDLDGELSVDPQLLTEASRDFGDMVAQAPSAVLRPKHARDIAAAIRFARRYELPVAARGQAHSTFGQAQAPAGIVVDSRSLTTIDTANNMSVWVDAGVTWRELLTRTAAQGLTPPVLTDYLDLSVGGVLSVGGIGGATHRHGLVVDHCLELEVVTGQGEITRCSASHERSLFRAVLGGLGQCAIIARARITLHAAMPLARVYQLTYSDPAAFLRDQRLACEDERFDFLQGLAMFGPTGQLVYIVQGARWYAPDRTPDNASALVGLAPLAAETLDLPYTAWAARVDANVAQWQAANLWAAPHPWCDLFMPDAVIDAFAAQALEALTPAELGAGVVLLYPFKREHLTRPMVKVPDANTLWLFDLLRIVGPGTRDAAALLAENRTLYERAVALGGKRYPIAAIALDQRDHTTHFAEHWAELEQAKQQFDPDRILTPGQDIFTPRNNRIG